MDIRPVTPGHLLVIPKRHAPSLADLDEATGARMFTAAMRLAQAFRASGLRREGINLFERTRLRSDLPRTGRAPSERPGRGGGSLED